MSNLAKYGGNFLQYLDAEFINIDGGKQYRFPQPISDLDIKVYCRVAVLPSDSQESSVSIESEDPDDFRVWVDGDRLCIEQKSSGGVSISSSGNSTVISSVGGNMSIINGQVFVNGVPIDHTKQSKPKKPSQVVIRCPKGIRLFADLGGQSILVSKVVFSKANVKLSGQGTLGIATKSLKMNLDGQGKSYVVMQGGDLDLRLSGQGDLQVKGTWDEADVSLSGMGSIFTEGTCFGDYSANVSGMGKIRHSGEIKGRARKSVSGMGSCVLG